MTTRVAINGFGRIGRLALRRILEIDTDLEIVGINSTTDSEQLAYLFMFDTVYGRVPYSVEARPGELIIDGKTIKVYTERDAAKIPWGELDVDIVLECTGIFLKAEQCQAHIDAGAKHVVISAPAKDETTKLIVFGINEDIIDPEDRIISSASCSTNCLAPMAKVLHEQFGLISGVMSTIHAYTASQFVLDKRTKTYRGGRAAAMNIIPYKTGAAKAVGKVIPELEGIVDGTAMRVPVATGSVIEFYSNLEKEVTVEEINAAMKAASNPAFEYNEYQIVSSDIIGSTAGSVFDATLTKIVDNDGDQLVKTVAWYDNEYGYTCNMIRLVEYYADLIK
ncbi:type I glyceraldehyde-3-phosphate dehydrogenase [Ignavigranum ruoffiae]|uniref:Glyceraldehyde-3-phosphate dehydrogenase n=1 Tax=Ignavigranum ruoffiae TaxID=89093 RepID=A0A1H9FYW4_9LACT|nr:type I glyceraldehyde-3-phosphate dehydrogenase [Ignavigranum ruoffiae]SEQ43021.1 glyceraldehyde 3-phosphate dehydrogenase [Ignavigranum ruoffiae]